MLLIILVPLVHYLFRVLSFFLINPPVLSPTQTEPPLSFRLLIALVYSFDSFIYTYIQNCSIQTFSLAETRTK